MWFGVIKVLLQNNEWLWAWFRIWWAGYSGATRSTNSTSGPIFFIAGMSDHALCRWAVWINIELGLSGTIFYFPCSSSPSSYLPHPDKSKHRMYRIVNHIYLQKWVRVCISHRYMHDLWFTLIDSRRYSPALLFVGPRWWISFQWRGSRFDKQDEILFWKLEF